MRLASEVFAECRADIRLAIQESLNKIRKETGLNPHAVDINVEMIWTGPTFGNGNADGDYLLGRVSVNFTVQK